MGLFKIIFRAFAPKPNYLPPPRIEEKPRLRVVKSPSQKRRYAPPPRKPSTVAHGPEIKGSAWVLDGDTIVINKIRIRLAGIDAPEMNHPWGKKAKWELVSLCKGQTVTAKMHNDASYDREVATCYLSDGRDLSAELVKLGLALDWPTFSGGKYANLEPEGVRKRLWRAAAKQNGKIIP